MRTQTTSFVLVLTILAISVLSGTQVWAQTEYQPQRGTTPAGRAVSLSSLPQLPEVLKPVRFTSGRNDPVSRPARFRKTLRV
ncbi:MAG TPA: hypothetical protein VKA08_15505 [Balneolales bacterium]|nr:hypothetical protein [Balneolales bacterium]